MRQPSEPPELSRFRIRRQAQVGPPRALFSCQDGSGSAPTGLVALIEPHYPKARAGRKLYPLEGRPRIHLLEKHQMAAGTLQVINGYPQDKGLSLRQGTLLATTIIHAPSSTNNKGGKRELDMHQVNKGNQCFFRMKARIGAEVESGLHHVHGTAANDADVTQVTEMVHGEETRVYADASYGEVEKREKHAEPEVI